MLFNTILSGYVFKSALRDRFIYALILIFLVSGFLSAFFGSVVVVDKGQATTVFAATSIRVTGIIGLVLFMVSFIRRSFETYNVEYVLTRGISRFKLISSYAFGGACVALLIWAAQVLALLFIMKGGVHDGAFLWLLGVLCENILMIVVALFMAMVLSNVTLASLACFGFYMLARMVGQLINLTHIDHGFVREAHLTKMLDIISVILPRLDLMSQTSWLIYDAQISSEQIIFPLIQCFVYGGFLLMATAFDFKRKVF